VGIQINVGDHVSILAPVFQPVPSRAAEEALLHCGLGKHSEGTTNSDDPRTPFDPCSRWLIAAARCVDRGHEARGTQGASEHVG